MKSVKCRDVGVNCDHVITGTNEQEILAKAAKHGREQHNIKELTDDLKVKIRTNIKEAKAA